MRDDVVLACSHLRRVFGRAGRDEFVAIEDVSLEVGAGRVHALLGPNGAGKTTTVRMCAALLSPTSGAVRVDGVDAVRHPERARARLGLVLGGELGFYPRASTRDNLLFFADLPGLDGAHRHAAVDGALERVGLTDVAARRAGRLSRGMHQRLHVARALLGSPAVLLLDEPTAGLDPDMALRMRDLVRDLAAQGTAVLLTSHSMPEIEELADVISVIGAGRIVTRGSVGDIAAYAGITTTTTLTLPARHSEVTGLLQRRLAGEAVVGQRPSSGRWAVTVYWMADASPDAGLATLHEILSDRGAAAPADMVTRPASLEEAYLALADRIAR